MASKNEKYKEQDVPPLTLKEKCMRCLNGPKKLLRTCVFISCVVIVVIQITACLRKIRKPPITTYSHFDFNQTVEYPAITVCRDPPYKVKVLKEYGLYGHPIHTSEWKNFDFANKSLDVLWNESTYTNNDNLIWYGLNNSIENVSINNTYVFELGQCQTFIPRIKVKSSLQSAGYSITLNHSFEDIINTPSIIQPGYHVFVHSTDEPFTEVIQQSNSLVEYIYINFGEDVDVKLTVKQFFKLDKPESRCENDIYYSASKCTEQSVMHQVYKIVGCIGPWMQHQHQGQYCNTYEGINTLISNYTSLVANAARITECAPRCSSTLYGTHVVKRTARATWDSRTSTWILRSDGIEHLQTTLFIYIGSMMVEVYEETLSYDWSMFLADCGGSLGFLLGLSVLGVIGVLEKIWDIIIHPFISKKSQTDNITTGKITKNENELFDKKELEKQTNTFKLCS